MAKDLVNLLIVALVLIVGLTLILYFLPCGTTIEKFAPLSPAARAREVARQQQIRIMQDSVKQLKDFQKVANPTVAQVMSVKATAKKIVDARPYVSIRTAALNVESAGYTPAAVNGAAAVKTAVNNLLVKIGEVSATSSAVKKVLTAKNPSPATIKKAKVAAKKLAAPSSKASPAVKAAAKKVVAAKTPAQAKVAAAKLAVATAKTPAAKVAAKKVLVKAVAKKLAAPSSKASPAVKAAAMKVVAAKTPAQAKVATAELAAVAKTPAGKHAVVKVAATKVAAAKTPAQVKAAAKKLIVAAKPNAAATHPAVKAAVAKLKAAKTTKSAKAAAANLVAVSHAVSGTGATASVNNAMLTSAQCSSLCPVGYKNDSTVPAAAIRRTVATINAANPHVLDTMFSTPLISGFQDVNDPDDDEPLHVAEGFYDDEEGFEDLNMDGIEDDEEGFEDLNMDGIEDDEEGFEDLNMDGIEDDEEGFEDLNMDGIDDDDEGFEDLNMDGIEDDEEGFYAPVGKSTMITNYKPGK